MTRYIDVPSEDRAADARFIEGRAAAGTERYLRRHSLQARLTHGIAVACCLWLCISGLFVFVPPLTTVAGQDAVLAVRLSHRVIGVVFVLVPLISALLAPRGAAHVLKSLFARWDADDRKWMALFFPYLFTAKRMHMPDQHEMKSGQRFADGMLWASGLLMAVTGVGLLLATTWWPAPAGVHGAFLFLHDVGFFLIAVFGMAHVFLGGGLFQPYRGTHRLMFGDGLVSESDALYHWGHWARKELESGENVVER